MLKQDLSSPPKGFGGVFDFVLRQGSTGVIWLGAIFVTAWSMWLISDIVFNGWAGLSYDFLTHTPTNAGREGGIAPILVSTGLVLAICMAVSFPIGLGTAILLSEITATDSWWGGMIRRSLDVLAGVPSIVFGLFGNAFFCNILGLGFSILSGGLTLACMVLPILIRSTEEGFRAVPIAQKLGASALGLSRLSTLFYILLPIAVPGLIAGFVLGVGRAVAETAALIFTSGYVDRYPESWLDSGRVLSIHIYDLSMNIAGGEAHAYTSALVLLILVLLINQTASHIGLRYLRRGVT